ELARRFGEVVDVERKLVRDPLECLPLQGLVVVRPRPEEERESALERRRPGGRRPGPGREVRQGPASDESEARRSKQCRERDGEPEGEVRGHAVVRRGERG